MDDKIISLYKDLKKLREIKSKSQTNVSEYMGYNLSSSLSHVEAGRKNISIDKLIKWLEALDINLDDIIKASLNGIDFNLLNKAVKNKDSSNAINEFLKIMINKEKK
ncbi:XRE family transcriptional regulator [Apilactobacillus micheneri]|uniref:XRE family transcriptional regulator n=1 Tax=Apilactobacillus micheneri TaxID=1899430 RepID=A0ABY2YY61_9LACO|nr:helix-turn-helix transcriptional regulator [Apilactobacillus micheneri]TPR26258.1 XRE family transcriptional regulator [Apilactobacillus micheneri]TPR27012.1 XRE family transcriptional regulator [Apilactobacillus micheneri]TPR27870.1 XRE family transcriptional regulator [Apilactobacillus micheneri]TPR31775.1 XRE family transcriptional regulator [Apilactobacillus micheneri]TPR32179.1 XRE family transcriptional regulator [Apilactobacillus micheneri]